MCSMAAPRDELRSTQCNVANFTWLRVFEEVGTYLRQNTT